MLMMTRDLVQLFGIQAPFRERFYGDAAAVVVVVLPVRKVRECCYSTGKIYSDFFGCRRSSDVDLQQSTSFPRCRYSNLEHCAT